MEIDLVRLCRSANCRLVISEFESIDRQKQRIKFNDRADLEYDWLSIGIGSRPSYEGVTVQDATNLIPIKPMQTFLNRLTAGLIQASATRPGKVRCLIVGGGLGSIETALCLANRNLDLETEHSTKTLNDLLKETSGLGITLLTASAHVGKGLSPASIRRIENALRKSSVNLISNERVVETDAGGVVTESGKRIKADLVIWATAAIASPEMESTSLELDQRGFAKTKNTLQSVNDDRIFVVGDSGTMIDSPTDKAGVFAVRQGPVLWQNLNNISAGHSLKQYEPQRDFLKLVNIGDGTAIGQIRGRSFGGRFAWWLKNRIDRKFMAMYQDYSVPLGMNAPANDSAAEIMRCLGCGGKIGGQLLHAALDEIDWHTETDVVDFEAAKSDDAAIIRTGGDDVTVSTDFFASPVDDPWLAGRISVLNSISDLYVMGAKPTAALALVQINEGHPRGQLRMMRELMAGTALELRNATTAMAGGHTIEGERLATGFTVLGRQVLPPQRKSGLKPGDALILSKPLGSGTILAAMMQNLANGNVWHEFSKSLTFGNAIALEIGKQFDLSAMTDVTGFGLAGHLSEMLRSSLVSAELDSASIPLFSGFLELSALAIASTLAPANEEFAVPVRWQSQKYPAISAALFDPQTCGGILLGCSADSVERIVAQLHSAGHINAARIGTAIQSANAPEIVML
jgi:selenide,water dikinase